MATIGALTVVAAALNDDPLWTSLLAAVIVYVAMLPVLTLVGAVLWWRRRSGRRLWVADDAGVRAGLEVQEVEGQPVRVSGLYAVPRGQGHAGRLTKELLSWADREGKTLTLTVVGVRLRQRYEAAGFRPDPRQRGLARHLLPRLLRAPGARGAPAAPGLRGLAALGLGPSLAVAAAAAVAVVSGSYWLIGRLVTVDPAAVLSPAQRLTGAFAAATAVGAVVALTLRTRRQDLDEQLARREIAAAFTERFRAASTQLGGKAAAERLAGVYAMAALADEYPQHRQQCVDVLCGYLRLPFDPSADDIETQTQIITATLPDGAVKTRHTTPARRLTTKWLERRSSALSETTPHHTPNRRGALWTSTSPEPT